MAPRYLLIVVLLALLGYGVTEILRRQNDKIVAETTAQGGSAATATESVAVDRLGNGAASGPHPDLGRENNGWQSGRASARLQRDDVSLLPPAHTAHGSRPIDLGARLDVETVYDMVSDPHADSPVSIGEYVSADAMTGQVEDRYAEKPREVGEPADADAPFPLPDAASSDPAQSIGDFLDADP